jgi:exopolysaccharide biosynthesis polyprenyl glycosylphosphotransferase
VSIPVHTVVADRYAESEEQLTTRNPAPWMRAYLRRAVLVDSACALAASLLALGLRFGSTSYTLKLYLAFSLSLPIFWVVSVALARGYDARFIGGGSDEFRRILNAAVSLTAAVAVVSYAAKLDIARGYIVFALPCATAFDLVARYALRRRLHRLRRTGGCMRRTVAVGHASAVVDLVTELRRDSHHGLAVVAACVADAPGTDNLAGVPVCGGLDDVVSAVRASSADAVAVLACPEMNGVRLRALAWELEKTDTDLSVAPALMDVAGPRTTIRSVAGLPLLHVDHPELDGAKQVVKEVFDRMAATAAVIILAPLLVMIAIAIRLADGGPALFRQTRVGKDGRTFTVLKFRTMVANAEALKARLMAQNDLDGVLFKIRHDPRVTKVGVWLRRWSLDELPQLFNVLLGDMSLVGPRPALPEEAARYAAHVRRRLVVKPGLTGLWQVNGRSDLSWDESVRLDLRYVENWSLALDLQILWKTGAAVRRGSGAY